MTPWTVCASCRTLLEVSVERRGYNRIYNIHSGRSSISAFLFFVHSVLGTKTPRKPTHAATTGSSTSVKPARVVCKSSNAFAFVVSSFLDRFLNSTTTEASDKLDKSGGSVTYESCEAADEENVPGESNPKLKDEGAPRAADAALLLRAGPRLLLMVAADGGVK